MSDFKYHYFFVKGKPARVYRLPSGIRVKANIFIEEQDYENQEIWYSVYSVDFPGNILTNIYDGIFREEAWNHIHKEAEYIGSSNKYEEISIIYDLHYKKDKIKI